MKDLFRAHVARISGIAALAVIICLSMTSCMSLLESLLTSEPSTSGNRVTFAGNEVPAKWQRTFEVWGDESVFIISSNSGTLTISGTSQSFSDLNIRGGGTLPGYFDTDPPKGEWAYLYSGDVKIGYIVDEVDWINRDFDLIIQVDVVIGPDSTQEKLREDRLRAEDPWNPLEGMFDSDTDFSDVPDTIPNWEGRYTLEGHIFG